MHAPPCLQEQFAPPSVQLQGSAYSSPFSTAAPGAPHGGLPVNSADFPPPLGGSGIGPDWQPVSLPALPMDFPGLHAAVLPPHSAGSEPLPPGAGRSATQRQGSAPVQVSWNLSLRMVACRPIWDP